MPLNELSLEKRLKQVSNSTESIQSLSYLCLHYGAYHKKIAHIWLKCLQKAEVNHRLTLIYLANDIVQNAKRKRMTTFIADFKTILKNTIPYLKDSKIKSSVERVFSIWQDREIFETSFLTELKASLNSNNNNNFKNASESITPPLPPPPATNNDTIEQLQHVNSNRKQKSQPSPQVQQVQPIQPILPVQSVQPIQPIHHRSSRSEASLVDCLDRLVAIEKNIELLNQNGKVVDRLAGGEFANSDGNNDKILSDVKNYMNHLKDEIDERTKLSKLLEDSTSNQRKLLKETEDELVQYRAKLEYVSKMRDDLRLTR